jgi:competence protein ComEC
MLKLRLRIALAAAILRTRPYHVGLAALAVGLALAPAPRPAALLAAAAALVVLTAARTPGLAVLSAVLIVAGSAFGVARLDAQDRSLLSARAPGALTTEATLAEAPRPSPFGARVVLEVSTGPGVGEQVMAYTDREARWPKDAGPGLMAEVSGSLRRPRTKPNADFDWPAYLRRRGIALELRVDRLRVTGRRRGGLAGAIDTVRRRAERGIAAGLSPAHVALARGMVLGEDERVAEADKEDFRRSGLAHILAVSGQNVMLLCALAVPFLMAAGAGPRARAAAMLALIAVYVPLAGAGPSLQRAGVMGAAGLVALGAARPSSRWYALLLAAAATLALNPRVAADPGWQLSFAAVISIIAIGGRLRSALAALPGPLAEGIALTVAATIGTAPLLAHHFDTISLSGLPANVVAMPAVAATMWLGMLGAAVGQLTALPALAEPALALATVLGWVNGLCLSFIEAVARRFAEAPGAAVALPLATPEAVALAYAAIAAVVLAAVTVTPRLEPWVTTGRAAFRRLPARRRHPLLAVAAALVLVGCARVLAPPGPPSELTVSYLDIGQGDATLVQSPEGGAILFDGGPPEAGVVRLLERAGVKRLSAVVATHQSRDHQGGLREVLETVPSDLYVDAGDGNRDPDFLAIAEAAARRRVRLVVPRQGDVLRAPGLTVRVLGPAPRSPGPAPEDPNPRALVTVVSAGDFDLFLSGDAESEALTALDLPDVEAMKVSHHGSKDPGLPAVLARLRPQIAGIEVGESNGYGHPAPQTLAALRSATVRTYRTDRDGTVKVTVADGGLRVDTER